jgi:hypothetical protein
MKKISFQRKLWGILVCILIVAAVLPAAGSMSSEKNNCERQSIVDEGFGSSWQMRRLSLLSNVKGKIRVASPPVYDSPEDLFEMDVEKNLTLEDLGWREVSEKIFPNGVVCTVGTWNAGQFATFNSKDNPQTIILDEKAAIFWPPNYPHTPNSQAGFGAVFAAHVETSIYKRHPEILAEVFEIPILQHGESPSDWEELGFKGRNEMVEATFKNVIKANPCEAYDLTYGNFGWALAKTNIRAITLLQRLAEERSGSVTKVALKGGSKEGFATWLVSAVDDRVEVDASGGYHLQDLVYGLNAYATDWGCEGTGAAGTSVIDLLLALDWLLNAPAGEAALKTHSISTFHEILKPRFFLISGDVTRYDMHDGQYYALGSETPFLENFTSHPWRYDRLPNLARENSEVRKVRLCALLLEQLINGPEYHKQVYPKITSVDVEEHERSFRIKAEVFPEPEEVRLWWSHSDDRVWNDKDNPPFEEVEMIKKDGRWVSPWVEVPGTDEVAWYVEAENTFFVKEWELPRRDASPVRFLWRHPEVGCEIEAPDWCEPPPETPRINGPTSGKTGEEYTYTFVTTDPDGDDVYFYIDWGDGKKEEWIGPYASGEEITIKHTWNEKGNYVIKAKAKNINSVESGWGALEVSISKRSRDLLFHWFFNSLLEKISFIQKRWGG